MSEKNNPPAGTNLTAAQKFLHDLWEEHVRCEFVAHDPEATLATMVEDAYVNHIPVMTGGMGRTDYGSSTPNASFHRCPRTPTRLPSHGPSATSS